MEGLSFGRGDKNLVVEKSKFVLPIYLYPPYFPIPLFFKFSHPLPFCLYPHWIFCFLASLAEWVIMHLVKCLTKFHSIPSNQIPFYSFPSNSQRDASFYCIAYDCFCADWDGLRDHFRDFLWEDIFKLGTSAGASEFCECVQVGIDVYIPHRKYQVKPHSSPWFSAACAAATVHRNLFFHLYQKDKSSDSKIKFRQASNCCKRVLEGSKLAYAYKTKKSSLLRRNVALVTFGELLILFSTKVNLLYLLY